MVAVSVNTGSAPLIGSQVIRDHASNGSVWSDKTGRTPDGVKKRLEGPRILGLMPDQNRTASGPRQSGHKVNYKNTFKEFMYQWDLWWRDAFIL